MDSSCDKLGVELRRSRIEGNPSREIPATNHRDTVIFDFAW
ncbi:MAG TPA: hypothetical protein VFI27_09645 [candidate division Zixibacteria bacterium]|nr:hypothetical protein [candidate division Zixibacteria bacterium]